MKGTVRVESQTKEEHDIRLTPKQWKIYYKLMSISKYDARHVENHRYIYKNSIVKSEICYELGIKSTNTFNSAIKKLESLGLLIDYEERGYYLLYAKNWVDIKLDVLLPLINWSRIKENEIDLLRTFLVLKLMDKIGTTDKDRSFTACDILTILGHSTNKKENY